MSDSEGTRFSSAGRHLVEEDVIRLVSVGVDIGSSTSHLVFSRLELERQDNRYVTTSRRVLAESEILLTPYRDVTTIDGEALSRFVEAQYAAAGLRREDVDTGALILTGVALLRENSRAIADLFAAEAGRFVAVSAGDNLEALMAAHGSGAMELSERGQTVMNVDIGGGTTKIVVCTDGHAASLAAVDVGARLAALDDTGRISRLEASGRAIGEAVGLDLMVGRPTSQDEMRQLAAYMADRLMTIIRLQPLGPAEKALLRTPAPAAPAGVDAVTFSGGVSEFFYKHESRGFGDLGPLLAEELRQRVREAGLKVLEPRAGIRATVIGASQYTIQVSGSTIFIAPDDAVPVRNVPVVRPALALGGSSLDSDGIARAVASAVERMDLGAGHSPVALAVQWQGLATFGRIDAFCRGVAGGLAPVLQRGHPLILVFEGDVGGLFGIHLKDAVGVENAIISIDGIELKEFDYIDIGEMIPSSGAAPVVIKSLVFPTAGATATRPS